MRIFSAGLASSYLLLSAGHSLGAEECSNNPLSELSVIELKRRLQEINVDFRDCLGKRDLVERLASSRHVVPTPDVGLDAKAIHERALIRTFQDASPAVACIFSFHGGRSRSRWWLLNPEFSAVIGSGFIWDSKGHVITNCDVLELNQGSKSVKVKLNGVAEPYEAVVVGLDRETGVAVLRILDTSLQLPKPLELGSTDDLQVGQSVLAIGNPFGLATSLTTGVVSAVGVNARQMDVTSRNCVQVDAAINGQNSGGPLVDSSGKLIGLNVLSRLYPMADTNEDVGIYAAISVDTVRRVANQLIRHGSGIQRYPSFGDVVNDRVVQQLGRQLDRDLVGVLLSRSPSVKLEPSKFVNGSVRLGDLIIAVDKEPVQCVEDLLSILDEREIGQTVRVTIQRRCEPEDIETVIFELP